MKRPWTSEDDKQLRLLAKSAIGSVAIAIQMFRSRNAIRQRACYLKVKILPKPDHKRWTTTADTQLIKLTKYGYTVEQIAQKMDRDPQSIYNRSITLKLNYSFTDPSKKHSLKSPIDKTDTSMWEGVSWKSHRLPLNRFSELLK